MGVEWEHSLGQQFQCNRGGELDHGNEVCNLFSCDSRYLYI